MTPPTDPALPAGVFVPDGDGFVPTGLARGPWDPAAQHGGAASALLATLVADTPECDGFAIARLTVELLRPVPLTRLTADVQVVRPGRRVQLLQAELQAEGVPVCRALALAIRRDPEVGAPRSAPSSGPVPPLPPPEVRASGPPGTSGLFFGNGAMDLRFADGAWGPGPGSAWLRFAVPLVAGRPTPPLARALAAADFGNGISSPLSWEDWVFINPDLTVYLDRMPVGDWICVRSESRVQPDGTGLTDSELFDASGRIGRALQALYVARR